MKISFLSLLIFACVPALIAQGYRAPALTATSVSQELSRIDLVDGKEDQAICISNEDLNQRGNTLYFELIPLLDSLLQSELLPPFSRQIMRSNLVFTLKDIDEDNYDKVAYWERRFRNLYQSTLAIPKGELLQALLTDIPTSLENFSFYQYEPEVESFIRSAAISHPVEVLQAYDAYAKRPYAKPVVITAGKQSPEAFRGYLGTSSPIADIAEESEDPAIQAIVRFYKVFKGKTRAYALIELIANQGMSLETADMLAGDDMTFFQELIKVRSLESAYGMHTADRELNRLSLEVVRLVNEDHDNLNLSQRFAPVDGYSPEEIYTLTVYTQSEIFTSTFNGFFDRMMSGLDGRSAYSLLDSLGFNRFRTFIKMSAGYSKLEDFLATMSMEERTEVLQMFASGLEKNAGDLEAAVDVADALGSITDSTTKAILTSSLKSEMNRVYKEGNEEGVVIYSLLNGLFLDVGDFDSTWAGKLEKNYQIPHIDKVLYSELFNEDSIHIQWHFFYDDKDGKASYASFIATFRDADWKIEEAEHYVVIRSVKGKDVRIYANKPESEYTGQDQIEEILADSSWSPHMVVHRGHSYYADLTISHIPKSARIAVLGSCGGYHNLSVVLQQAPGIHIVSSKQIGRMAVNNPLLKGIADKVREGENLDWPELWLELDEQFPENSKAEESFRDYIPPHKNLGAIFIQAYRNIMAAES